MDVVEEPEPSRRPRNDLSSKKSMAPSELIHMLKKQLGIKDERGFLKEALLLEALIRERGGTSFSRDFFSYFPFPHLIQPIPDK